MYQKRDGWNFGTDLQLTTITIPLYYKLQWCSRFALFHHTLTYHTLYHSPYQQGQRDQFHLTGMWKTLMLRSCVIHVEWKVFWPLGRKLHLFYWLLYFYLEKNIALNCPHGSLQMMPRVALLFSFANVRKVLELSLDEKKLQRLN